MDSISVTSIGRVTEIGHLSCLPVQGNRQVASSNRGTLPSRGRIVCPGHFEAVVYEQTRFEPQGKTVVSALFH
jgi:hypothetical protein